MGYKKVLRVLLPAGLRLQYKLWCHAARDARQKIVFASQKATGVVENDFPYALSETQPIQPSPTLENKLHNLRLGAASMQHIIIHPNEVFCFWKLVGHPAIKNGFVKSRSIIDGKLALETGGGLCQLSGILYLLALKAGLFMVERHPHSLDIYAAQDRFAPLGADATVAFGYKGFRFKNSLNQSICISLIVLPTQLTAFIHCQAAIVPQHIVFDSRTIGHMVQVQTFANNHLLYTNNYKKLAPATSNTP